MSAQPLFCPCVFSEQMCPLMYGVVQVIVRQGVIKHYIQIRGCRFASCWFSICCVAPSIEDFR